MKKIIMMICLVGVFSGCAVLDVYTDGIKEIGKSWGEEYVEEVTGEEFSEDKLVDDE